MSAVSPRNDWRSAFGRSGTRRVLAPVVSVWSKLVDSLCDVLDPIVRKLRSECRLVVLLSPSGDLRSTRVGAGHVEELGALDALPPDAIGALATTRWRSVELRLPDEQILRRTLSLPASSQDYLGPIIQHRLERLSPWSADQVLYGFTAAKGADDEVISVSFAATSREAVVPLQARLAALGLSVTALGAAGDPIERPPSIDLIGTAQSNVSDRLRRPIAISAITTLCATLIAAIASHLWLAAADEERGDLTEAVAHARHALQRTVRADRGTPEERMLEEKRRDASVTVLIDGLARLIPPDTFLHELAIAPDKVRLAGSSADAAALIAKLEGQNLFSLRFSSPVSHDKDDRDTFEITAERSPAKKNQAGDEERPAP